MLSTALLSLAAAAPQVAADPSPTENQTLPPLANIELPLEGPGALTRETLFSLDLDLIELRDGFAVALAPPWQLVDLERRGVPFTVVREDEQRYYAERLAGGPLVPLGTPALGANVSPPFAAGAISGYYSFAEVVSILDQLRATYPELISAKSSIGQTLEGRQQWMVRISDNPDVDENEPEVRYDAMHHSREPQGMQTTLWYMFWLLENYGTDPLATWLVDEREQYFLPVVNPDGYVYNQLIEPNGGGLWRKNRRDNGDGTFGVDLNRNYPFQWGFDNFGSSPTTFSETYRGPSPASEPETQNMIGLIQSRQFQVALSTHTFSNIWLEPWGYAFVPTNDEAELQELGELCTEFNGYTLGQPAVLLGNANGVTFDYDYSEKGTYAWTPEIGSSFDGFWPPQERIVPLAEENLVAFQRAALGAGAFVYVDDSSTAIIGDGDAFADPGESVEIVIDLRNAGRSGTGSAVVATLVLDSGGAAVTQGASNYGAIGSFQGASNQASPLALTVEANATPGSTIDYRVIVSYEGLDQELLGSIVVGEPRLLLVDELESDLGWTAGLPGDTAQTGIWEYGNPNGTTSGGGDPVQPEDDATPGGTLCFVTGNGDESAGSDDIDDGFTRLLSPRIDLSGASAALLGYARWWADFTVADDELLVEVSNDDGISWVTLEQVAQTANSWTNVSFALHQSIPLTDAMRLRVTAGDDPNNSLTEAAFDDLVLSVYGSGPRIGLYGSPTVGGSPVLLTSAEEASSTTLFGAAGTGALSVPGIEGDFLLDLATTFTVAFGTAAPGAPSQQPLAIPNDPALTGATIYLQQFAGGASPALSNRLALTFE